MDQELIAYLEERFRENSRQVQSFREETSRQIEGLRGEVGTLIREEVGTLRQEVGTLVRQEVGTLRQEIMSRFEQVDGTLRQAQDDIRSNKDEIRHTQILMEALRSDLQGVAEGVMSNSQRIETLRDEMKQEVGEVSKRVDLSYTDMNKRVRSLEEWKKRAGKAPIARVREKSAKKS